MAELAVDRLTLRFGGLTVLDGVSLAVEKAQLFALLGPNGAGKTSVLNCVSGIYHGQGRIRFRGTDIAGLKPHAIARLGLARTFQHGELFAQMSGLKMVHVPYRGTGPALNDLAAGVVDAYFGDPATLGIIKSGKARAMAVTSPEPWPPLPDAPPLGSAVAGYEAWNWYGMDAPPGTPQPIVELLAAAIRKVMAEPEIKKKYDDNGLHPATLSHDEYVAFIKRDSEVWGKVIRTGNIKPDD